MESFPTIVANKLKFGTSISINKLYFSAKFQNLVRPLLS